jgi:putative endopeptidase
MILTKHSLLFVCSCAIFFSSCKIFTIETKSGKVEAEVKTPPILEENSVIVSSSTFNTIVKEYMNPSIRPQEDFFAYCNGNWILKNPVPPSESRWGSFNELEKTNKIKLTAILLEAMKNPGEKGSQNQLLGDYYASFLGKEVRDAKGMTPLQGDLDKIINLRSKQEVVSILAESHKMGIGSFFSFGVGQDLKNVEKNIASIGQGGIGLPNCEYYTDPNKASLLSAYQSHISTVFGLMNYDVVMAANMANSVVTFEQNLASAMMKPAELRVPENTYNLSSKKNLEKKLGKFDLESYLQAIGIHTFDSLVVEQPKYIEKIASIFETEKIENWKNYLLWCTVNHFAGHLSTDFVQANFNFYSGILSGKKEIKPANERAIDELTGIAVGELLGKAFVDKHFSITAQNRVNGMVDNLLIVFKERIQNLEWMSTDTKKQALIKLSSIGRKLGYPTKWEDFSSLHFTRENYIENIKEMARYSYRKSISELYQEIDKKKWGMPAHMVNAYYHPLLNEIAFPAGIMQAPFFDEEAEDAVNYGTIGMVIGHEFTHGFDDMGSKFDANGTFRNWWSENDLKLFTERTELLGQTFAHFCPIEGHCVNPDLTMGENIADLGGLTMAYHAYTLTKEYQSGILRSGYSPAQRFFIAYAQLWKINYTEAEMKNRIANDPHSPGMFRVNGPLMNCPEFFDAFQVIEGDKMRNSAQKIAKIW